MNANLAKSLALAAFIGAGATLCGLGVYITRQPDQILDDESYTRHLITGLDRMEANPKALASLRRLARRYRAQGKTAQANLVYQRALHRLLATERQHAGAMENRRLVQEDYRVFLREEGLSQEQIDVRMKAIHQDAGS